jgi:hypothetical protein
LPVVRLSLKEIYNWIAYYECDLKGLENINVRNGQCAQYLLGRSTAAASCEGGPKNTIALPEGPG